MMFFFLNFHVILEDYKFLLHAIYLKPLQVMVLQTVISWEQLKVQ